MKVLIISDIHGSGYYAEKIKEIEEKEKPEENQEIKDIIEVLNKKTRLQRIAYIYDKSCEQIDKKFEGENICEFKCNQCIVQRKHNLKEKNGCCRVCRLQTSTGCPSKNLTCKLFFCDEVKNKYEVIAV